MKNFRLTVFALLLAGMPALAQEVTGTILGTVSDKSGAVVRGASVTITNTDRNSVIRTTKTDGVGQFVALLLPIGHYQVTVEAPGFKKFEKKDIELNVSDRLTVNATLDPGGANEVITVTAEALQVDTQ